MSVAQDDMTFEPTAAAVSPPPRLTSPGSISSLHAMPPPRKLRLLIAATGPRDVSWARPLVVRLCKDPSIEMRAIVDEVVPRLSQTVIVLPNQSTVSTATAAAIAAAAPNGKHTAEDVEFYRQQAFELVEWADMLVLAPLDADGIAKMLAGVADTLLLEVLRGWDQKKKILLVPGMSTHVYSNPTTKKHLSKIQRKWPWVRTLSPILWHYETNSGDTTAAATATPKRVVNWNGFNDLLGIVKNQADILGLGREIDLGSGVLHAPETTGPIQAKLPPEIWSIILEFVGDWELAQALGIFDDTRARGLELRAQGPWRRAQGVRARAGVDRTHLRAASHLQKDIPVSARVPGPAGAGDQAHYPIFACRGAGVPRKQPPRALQGL
jgi:hypothetical protein